MKTGILALAFLLSFASPAFSAAHVQEVEAKNGLKAWLIEDHTLPIITARVAFDESGAAYDPAGKEGLANFVSGMLDEGAGGMDSLAFHSALESNAIKFEAGAGEDIFSVSLQTLSRYKDKAFDLFDLALAAPHFDDEAVERIRAGSISELKEVMEDPSYRASLAWKEAAFAGHAYGRPRKGTFDSVAHITRGDLQAFAKWHFTCSPKIIAVVGDMTARQVQDWLIRLPESNVCGKDPYGNVADVVVAASKGAPVIVSMNVPQTVVTASLPGIKRTDPRFYAAELLNDILGGNSLTARLGKEIRDKRGLAYYAESEAATFDHSGYFAFSFASRSAKAKEATQIFEDTLKDIADHGVTSQELADAKSYLAGSFPLQLDNQQSLADYLLSMQHMHLGIDYLDKRNSLIDAVTLAQVNDVAKEFLSQMPLIIMAGQSEGEKKP